MQTAFKATACVALAVAGLYGMSREVQGSGWIVFAAVMVALSL